MTSLEPHVRRYESDETPALSAAGAHTSLSRVASLLLWAVAFVVMAMMSIVLAA